MASRTNQARLEKKLSNIPGVLKGTLLVRAENRYALRTPVPTPYGDIYLALEYSPDETRVYCEVPSQIKDKLTITLPREMKVRKLSEEDAAEFYAGFYATLRSVLATLPPRTRNQDTTQLGRENDNQAARIIKFPVVRSQ